MAKYELSLDIINSRIDELGKEQERILAAIGDEVELNSVIGTISSTFGRYDVESVYQKEDKNGHACMHCNINLPCSADVEVRFMDLSVDERRQIIELALQVLNRNYK